VPALTHATRVTEVFHNGHIVQMVVYGDYAPYNAGLFLYSEIAVSLLTLGLLLAYKVLGQRAQTQQAASVPV
jgi:hypothetical protein